MFDIGDVVPLGYNVTDAAGAPSNAATVVLTITLPDETVATPTVTNPPATTGSYVYDYVATQAGRHVVRWVTTTPSTAQTDVFDVDAYPSTALVSLDDVKDHLNKTSSDDDEELRRYIDAATDFIESRIGPVVRRTITKTVYPAGGMIFLDGPVVEVTSITSAYGYAGVYDVATTFLDSERGVIRAAYSSTFSYPVTVTYVGGLTVVPALIRQAALEYVKWMWESQRGPGNPVDLIQGGEFEVTAPATVPYRILQALEPYVSPVVA